MMGEEKQTFSGHSSLNVTNCKLKLATLKAAYEVDVICSAIWTGD